MKSDKVAVPMAVLAYIAVLALTITNAVAADSSANETARVGVSLVW